jgi:hypothetical protein
MKDTKIHANINTSTSSIGGTKKPKGPKYSNLEKNTPREPSMSSPNPKEGEKF